MFFQKTEWCFDYNDEQAIEIFVSKKRKDATVIPPKKVVAFLSGYPKDLERRYLEYLIFDQKSCSEGFFLFFLQKKTLKTDNFLPEFFHTTLMINYIDAIEILRPKIFYPHGIRIEPGKESGLVGDLRKKVQNMLNAPDGQRFFSVEKVLDRLNSSTVVEKETGRSVKLYEEIAICYKLLRKVREHSFFLFLKSFFS